MYKNTAHNILHNVLAHTHPHISLQSNCPSLSLPSATHSAAPARGQALCWVLGGQQ